MKALIVVFLLALGAAADAAQVRLPKSVDLDGPGARDRIAAENPALAAKIEKILAQAGDQPPERVATWMKASFDAKDARYGQLLKTSDPPKAELSFVLGGTSYRAEVTLRNARPRLIPGTARLEKDAMPR